MEDFFPALEPINPEALARFHIAAARHRLDLAARTSERGGGDDAAYGSTDEHSSDAARLQLQRALALHLLEFGLMVVEPSNASDHWRENADQDQVVGNGGQGGRGQHTPAASSGEAAESTAEERQTALREAISLLRICAAAGDPDAQFDLAVCLERGRTGSTNADSVHARPDASGEEPGESLRAAEAAEALRWYRAAASSATSFAPAGGVSSRDDGKGKKSADRDLSGEIGTTSASLVFDPSDDDARGNSSAARAAHNLGVVFREGLLDVEADLEEAMAWFRRAAALGNVQAQYNLGLCLRSRAETGAAEPREAFECFLQAGRQGFAEAQAMLGVCFDDGFGVERDEETAVRWFTEAASQGLASAQVVLATCFLNGIGCVQDIGEARSWLERAIAQGDADAEEALAELLGSSVDALLLDNSASGDDIVPVHVQKSPEQLSSQPTHVDSRGNARGACSAVDCDCAQFERGHSAVTAARCEYCDHGAARHEKIT